MSDVKLFYPTQIRSTKLASIFRNWRMPNHRKKMRDANTQQKSRQIKRTACSSQNAPAKPIDDPDHGVEGIQQAPLLGNNARAISYR